MLQDYVRYGTRDILGLEPFTILRRIYKTYQGIDMSNICQTLDEQITSNWEEVDLTEYWCQQYIPEIVASLHRVNKTHCQS